MTVKNETKNIESDGILWRVHPLTENAWRSIALISVLLIVLAGVFLVLKHPFWVFLSAVLLGIHLRSFFLPTTYLLTNEGLEVIRLVGSYCASWSHYRSFCVDKNGVLLSPFAKPNRLENFRGNFILVPKDWREDVIAFLRKHLDEMEKVR